MKKRILALMLVMLLAFTALAGCGRTVVEEDLDYDAVVLTVGDEEITLRELYFLLKWRQSSYQAMASAQFGEDWYEQDITGEGPFGEYIKETIIDEVEAMYVLMQHAEDYDVTLSDEDLAKIDSVVAELMSENDENAMKALGLTEELAKRVVTNYTYYNKVYNNIIRDVDTTVTTEEATQKTYAYIYQPLTDYDEEGNVVDMTTEEQNSYYSLFQIIKNDVEGGKNFDEAAEEYGLSTATHSFGKQDDGSFNDINSIANELKVGEVSDLIPVEGGLFLLYLETDNDEEATEAARTTIASDKQLEAFEKEYEKLTKDMTIELDEELWATCTFEVPVVAYTEE